MTGANAPDPSLPNARGTPPAARGSAWSQARGIVAAALALLAVAYLMRFATSGGKRLEVYRLLAQVYLLLPDQLVTDLTSKWTGDKPGQVAFLDRAPVFGVAALLLAGAWGAGRCLLPARAQRRLGALERHLLSIAIGLNVWSLWLLLLGLAGGLHVVWLLRAPMLAAIAAASWLEWRTARDHRRERESTSAIAAPAASDAAQRLERRARWVWWGIAVPFGLFYLFAAALPPWEFDAREYHLQVPKEWFQQGRIGLVAHNVYGNMPLGAEMQALAGMMWMSGPLAWWWGALAGKVVMASLAMLTALALYSFAARYFSAWAGFVAAIVYLTMPWIFHVSVAGLVEGALAFYLWMSVYVLALAWLPETLPGHDEGGDAQERIRGERQLLGIAGFLVGASVACKYTSLVLVAVPLSSWVAAKTLPRRWPLALTFGLMLLAGCGAWYVKNLSLTGNPTYPLLYRVFGGAPWNEAKNERWLKAHGPPRNAEGERFSFGQLQAALIDLAWYSDKLTPLLLPLALFALLAQRQRRLLVLLAALVAVDFIFWWLLTHRYDRFFLPLVPPLALLAGVGADWTGHRAWRRVVLGFVGLGALLNFIVIGSGALTGDVRIFVALDALRRDEPELLRVHPAHRYLNTHVPVGSAALIVGDAQAFDLEVPIYYHTCWDDCFLEIWMKNRTAQQRLAELRARRISHVFIHWDEIKRYQQPGNYGHTCTMTRELVAELVEGESILRPVRVPIGDDWLEERSGQVFEVVYR